MEQFDAIVIGSGQAGGPLAKKLALAGKKTALVEKRWIGGTCVNDGCTPTKTWVASAKAAYMASHSKHLGIDIEGYSVNMPVIKSRKAEIVHQFRDGSLKGLEATDNLTVYFGTASFTGHKTIAIALNEGGAIELKADLFFINTGAKPFIPEVEGIHDIDYLDSTKILELDTVPEHLLILGGNYIGLEFGQMFSRFGSKITVLERSGRIVSREDEDVSETLHQILTAEEIVIYTNTSLSKLEKVGNQIAVTILNNGVEEKITVSHVLVATGRTPNTAELQLDKTGVEVNPQGFIKVNNQLETSTSGIYALGDVKGGPSFTHISYHDFTIVYRNLIEGANLNISDRPVPYCMFTDPQLGHIGLSEQDAKRLNLNYKVAKMPMAYVARAIENGDTRGFMKAIVNADTKQILGATVLGPEGGEIMTIFQMAMMGNITYEQLRYCVFAHPLYAESINNLFFSFDN